MNEWKEGPLGDILDKIVGGGTPSRNREDFWNGTIPWMSIKDYKEGKLYLESTLEFITEEGVSKSATNIIPVGTPIIGTRVGVGKIAIPKVNVAINQDLKALYPKERIDHLFLTQLSQLMILV